MIRELSERARAAERALRAQRALTEAQKRPPIRVRASVQPTFVRFVFEMPDGINVSSVLNEQKLTLSFNAILSFDLADAKVAAPPNIASINQKIQGDTSAVDITMIGDVDVHSFREDKNYIIDVAFQQSDKSPSALLPAAAEALKAPRRRCGRGCKAAADGGMQPAASGKPAERAAASEIVPPTSEMLAKQANIEIKPDAAPAMAAAETQPTPPRRDRAGEANRGACGAGNADGCRTSGQGSADGAACRVQETPGLRRLRRKWPLSRPNRRHRRKPRPATATRRSMRGVTAMACA